MYLKVKKTLFVSPDNNSLIGAVITIGDVTVKFAKRKFIRIH